MSTPTAEPELTAPAPGNAPPPLPAPTGLLRATAIVATVGVVIALIGLALLFRTVSTPTQECGTSIGWLLDGRVNEYVDVENPPEGITPAEAKANNAEPCRDRVADRARPASAAIAGGLLLALVAVVVEVTVRAFAWRRRRRSASEAADAEPIVS